MKIMGHLLRSLSIVYAFAAQKKFPVDNLAEWNNGHPLGLRTVHAYVLVFDMGNLETFQVSPPTPPPLFL